VKKIGEFSKLKDVEIQGVLTMIAPDQYKT
jgi:hypothetical protein